MRVAFVSDIHVDINDGPAVLAGLVERLRALAPDVFILAGDVATEERRYREALETLRAAVPAMFVVAGNHDVWVSAEALAEGRHSGHRLWVEMPRWCAEAGVSLLDAGPVELGAYGFVGTCGWYDGSMREADLPADEAAYRSGRFAGVRIQDVDHAVFLAEDGRRLSNEEVARTMRERLRDHLRAMRVRRIVAVTHTLPFLEQVVRKPHPGWRFANAFMGSVPLGALLRDDPRVGWVISGHTHHGSDLRIGKTRATVSPLGYPREWKHPVLARALEAAVSVLDLPG